TVLGLLGPNGAGKSTLVDLITGIQRADAGKMILDGRPLTGSASARAGAGLARTFQHPLLVEELSAIDNILIGGYSQHMRTVRGVIGRVLRETFGLSSTRREKARCDELLADYDLPDPHTLASDLSLGEQRLIEVARALMTSPSVLLLDEPFAGSDPHSREAIVGMIRSVVEQGSSVILVDHNVDIVTSVADRIVLMSEGANAFEGTAADALASQAMHDVYFGGPVDLEADNA
ncbi:MAG TPA: ATP-binding cassette domain-containing protein, partial [Microthrixaceae bacterium]|nr:ATP-binding cassette domain-containing protein [Microthrixaceae bacterium]